MTCLTPVVSHPINSAVPCLERTGTGQGCRWEIECYVEPKANRCCMPRTIQSWSDFANVPSQRNMTPDMASAQCVYDL